MLPTGTPSRLSDHAAATAGSPRNVVLAVLIMATAIGLKGVMLNRRSRRAEQIRETKESS